MRKREIKQGEVYVCNLSLDSQDSEQMGVRPCLILTCQTLNENRDNVNIAPITSVATKRFRMINHYGLLKEKYDFFTQENNVVLLECVRDISKNRLERKIGTIDKEDIENIVKLIRLNYEEKTD